MIRNPPECSHNKMMFCSNFVCNEYAFNFLSLQSNKIICFTFQISVSIPVCFDFLFLSSFCIFMT